MCGGHSYLPLDHILQPPTEDIINDVWDKPDDDDEMRHLIPKSCLTMKPGLQLFERKIQSRNIRLQSYVEFIRICAFRSFAGYKHSVFMTRIWLAYVSTITL